jgi:hypothetical protein
MPEFADRAQWHGGTYQVTGNRLQEEQEKQVSGFREQQTANRKGRK